MAVASNADDYANARLGIYFPADSNNTSQDGDLTGQCVSLIKWFLFEMCDIPQPFLARGNAKDFGDNLVAQGLAEVITAGQQKRGDVAVYKKDGGGYGHILVVLSNGQAFEENVGLVGAPSRNVNGVTVHPSRIDPLYASWRIGPPTFYRIKTYIENVEEDNMNQKDVQNLVQELWGIPANANNVKDLTGVSWHDAVYFLVNHATPWGPRADILNTGYPALQKQVDSLTATNIDQANQIDALKKQLAGDTNTNNIVITQAGWTALFDAVKSFFNKNKG